MRRYWVIGSIPFILVFLVTWLPQINGPHLWFGMPAMFVWVTFLSGIPISGILLYFELSRKDLDDEGDEK